MLAPQMPPIQLQGNPSIAIAGSPVRLPIHVAHSERVQLNNPELVSVSIRELEGLRREVRDLRKQVGLLRDSVRTGSYGITSFVDIDADQIAALRAIPEPSYRPEVVSLEITSGFRLVDLAILRKALALAQKCGCVHNQDRFPNGLLQLVEFPKRNYEELATTFAFLCNSCKKLTVFPNSMFSRDHPANYSVNKLMISMLGPGPYYKLSQFLESVETMAGPIPRDGSKMSQRIHSIDSRSFQLPATAEEVNRDIQGDNNAAPIEMVQAVLNSSAPSVPTRTVPASINLLPKPTTITQVRLPSQLGSQGGVVKSQSISNPVSSPIRLVAQQAPSTGSVFGGVVYSGDAKAIYLKSTRNRTVPDQAAAISPDPLQIKAAPPPLNPSSAAQIRGTLSSQQISPKQSIAKPSPSAASSDHIRADSPVSAQPPKKAPIPIKASKVLPAGSRISIIPSGTKIVGIVSHSTPEVTGLKPGVYRVRNDGQKERCLIVNRLGQTSSPVGVRVTNQPTGSNGHPSGPVFGGRRVPTKRSQSEGVYPLGSFDQDVQSSPFDEDDFQSDSESDKQEFNPTCSNQTRNGSAPGSKESVDQRKKDSKSTHPLNSINPQVLQNRLLREESPCNVVPRHMIGWQNNANRGSISNNSRFSENSTDDDFGDLTKKRRVESLDVHHRQPPVKKPAIDPQLIGGI